MHGYKTFTIAILILCGTMALVFTDKAPLDTWTWAVTAVGGMVGLRELGKGIGDRGKFNRGPTKNPG